MQADNSARNEMILKLRSENLSLSQIGRRMGISRSVVAGVLYRLGAFEGGRFFMPNGKVAKRRNKPCMKAVPFCPVSLAEPEPLGERDGGCQWLHGEAALRNFCGHPVHRQGTSWCSHHYMRAWRPGTSAIEQKREYKRLMRAA